jgi:hypothetical protein
MNRYVAQLAAAVLALFAGSAVAAALAETAETTKPKVALVVAGSAATQPAVLASARETAERTHAQLRVVPTAAEELGVTHLLAANHYDTVITFGVDRRIAIDPVAARYPETRFVEASAGA